MKFRFKISLTLVAFLLMALEGLTQTSITSFSPTSGPVGTLITINGTNLTNPDFVSIGIGDAIIVNSSSTRIQALVMPDCRTGVLSLRAGGRTVDAQGVFTITSNNLPNSQDGNKLVGNNGYTARQGAAVALSADGNTAIVGGFGDDLNIGAAWIFSRSAGVWSQQGQKLVGTGWVASPNQGYSVAISADGNTVAIGGYSDNGNSQGKTGKGAIWVFTRVGSFWAQQGSKLTASDGDANSQLGKSVSLSADGNTLLAGGNFDRTDQFTGKALGAAWVFTRFLGQWRQFGSKLSPTDNTGLAQFGTSVALSADGFTAVIGGETDNNNRGAAWVFNRRTSGFFQDVPKLSISSDGTNLKRIGSSVAVNADGNFLVVGGLSDDKVAAWVFSRIAGKWSLDVPKLMGSGLKNLGFNPFVSMSGDGYLVAVSGDLDNSTAGVATLWKRAIGSWRSSVNLPLGTPTTNSYFQGATVALSLDGTTAISGAPGTNANNGATWVYKTLQQGAVPQINTPVNNSTGNGPRPLISGTSDPVAVVNLYLDGSSIPIKVNANVVGDWAYTPSANLSDGAHTVSATATLSGVTSNSSALVYFNVVSPGPTIVSVSPTTGPVGTLVTITGNNLNNPDFVSIGGVEAIVVNSSATSLMAMVMPGSSSGSIRLRSAAKTVDAASGFTVTPTLVPNTQEGSKLVGAGGFDPKFGWSLAVSADGNTAVIGGYADDGNVGAAWVFRRTNAVWSQQGTKLVGSNFVNAPAQGYSVAISADGNTIAVGGNADAGYGPGRGAVWIFKKSGSQWFQEGRKIVGSGSSLDAQFATSISLSADGNTLVVGAPYENGNLGAVWAFTKTNDIWSQFGRELIPDDNVGYPEFGRSVAISSDGKTIAIGGNKDGSSGATWVFRRNATEFSQDADKLTARPDASRLQKEGSSVAISADGNTIITGGLSNNNPAAWVFVRNNGLWSQQSGTLFNPNAIVSSSVVSLSADGSAAILAIGIDDANIGSAITFKRTGTSWQQAGNLPLGTGAVGSAMQGLSAAVVSSDGTTALVGGSQDNRNIGAVWVYKYVARALPPTIITPVINSIVQTTNPLISGTAESNAVINLFIDGATTAIRINANPDGSWHYTPTNPLSEGGHTVSATATAGGTTSIMSEIVNFTVDTKPATLIYVSLASNNLDTSRATNGNNVRLSFTASEKIAQPIVKIAGYTVTANNIVGNQWTASINANSLPEGFVNFQIDFKDLAGNLGSIVTATTNNSIVKIDKTAPFVASVIRLDPSPTSATQLRFKVQFSEPVKGLNVSDFNVFTTGAVSGATILSLTGTGDSYIVTVNRGQGAGALSLDFNAALSLVKDLAGNNIRLSYRLGEIYQIVLGAINIIGTLQPFAVCAATNSATQNIQVNANGLIGELAIDAPTGFEVSQNPTSGFGPFVDLMPTNGIIPNTTIYVRVSQRVNANISGFLYFSTQNLGRQNIALTATVASSITTPIITSVGSTSVCSPGNVVLNSNAPSGNQWYRDGNLIAGASAASFTTTTTGGYTVVVTSGGCESNPSNVIAVSVNSTPALPVISAAKSTTVCEGTPVELSVSNASGNTWFKNGVLIPGATGAVYKATSTGAYTVQVANGTGCVSGLSAAINVTVNPFPVLDPIVGESQVCVSKLINLTNTNSSGYWSSSNPGIASVENNGAVTGVTAGTVNISYTVSTLVGCSKTLSKIVNVYDIPVLPEINGPSEICNGTTDFMVNAVAGGVWKSSNTNIVEINSQGTVLGKAAGTVNITYIYVNANGCVSTVTKQLTVVDKPFAEKIVGATAICLNTSTVFSNATVGGYWYSKNPSIATVDSVGIVSGKTVGTATIEYFIYNSTGCETAVSKDIVISAYPVLSPIVGVQEVCVGAVSNFSNAVAGGQWSSDNLNIALVNSQGVVRGVSPGSAKIIYSVANAIGCISSETRDIKVNAVPSLPVIAASKTSFCLPDSAILTSSATTGNNWYLNGTAIAGANTNSLVAKVSGNYTLFNTQLGCESPESVAITITANTRPATPTLNAIQTSNTCAGGSVQLITNNPLNNIWLKDGVSIIGARLNSYTATQTGVYRVVNVGFNACLSDTSNPVTVSFNALPVVAALTGNANICVGATTSFASSTAGGVWSSSNHQIVNIDQNGLITAIGNGTATISYTVTNASGCSTTVTRDITVNPLPAKPVASTSSATSFCLPGSAILNSNATIGNQWYRDGNILVGATNPTFTATQTGLYTLVSTVSGCASLESDPIDIQANATPTIPSLKAAKQATVCEGSTVKLTTSHPTGNIWYKDGVVIAGVTGGSYTATSSGVYAVQVANASGCVSGLSAGLTVTINPKTVVEPIAGRAYICIGTASNFSSGTTGGIWTSSNTAIANINSNGTLRGITAGTVTISYAIANASGCVTTITKDVTINAAPAIPTLTTNNPTSFCLPDSAVLNSTATLGNQWYLDGSPIAGANGSNYIAKVSGNYTVVSTQLGCVSAASSPITIEAKDKPAKPSLRALKSTEGCEGGSVPLLTNNTSNNFWFKDAVSIVGINANTYLARSSGSYRVINAGLNGCNSDSSDAIAIIMHPLPIVPAITGNQTICVGNNTQFFNTATNGYWSTNNSLVAKVDVNGLVTGVGAGSTTISYTISTPIGCSSTEKRDITVNPIPFKPNITTNNPASFCLPGSALLTSSASAGNQWLRNGAFILGATGATFTATATGSYTVINTLGGCESAKSDPLDISANATPLAPTLSANGATNICDGATVTLTTSNPTGNEWFKDGVLLNNISGPSYTTTSAGVFTVKSVNNLGCISGISNPITVVVNSLATVSAIAGNQVVCVGKSTLFSSPTQGGVWTSTNVNVASIDAVGNVTGIAAGTATILYTVTNSSGCVTTVSKDITVNALPVVSAIVGNTDLCVNATTKFNGSFAGNGIYAWSSSNTTVAIIGFDGTVKGLSAGKTNILYTVTGDNGCSVSVAWGTNVKPLPAKPQISTNDATSFCLPGAALLSSSATSGNQWYRNGALIVGANAQTYQAVSTGTYIVDATQSGCSSGFSNPLNIAANATPSIPTISANQIPEICEGGSITLSTSQPSGNTWFKNGITIPGVSGNSYQTSEAGTYTVQSSNNTGCVSGVSTGITVKVNPLPQVAALVGEQAVCIGSSLALRAPTPGGQWSSSDQSIAMVDALGNVKAISGGSVTINYTVTNSNGCSTVVSKAITVNNLPTANPILGNVDLCVGASSVLSNISVTQGIYTWKSKNTTIATIGVNGVLKGISTGTTDIVFNLIDANRCAVSVTRSVNIKSVPNKPSINTTDATSFCAPGFASLKSSANTGNQWFKDGLAIANATNKNYIANQSGTYALVNTQNGCASDTSDLITISANATPALPSINTTQPTSFCEGGSVVLTTANQTGNIWYKDGLIIQGETAANYTAKESGAYSVQVTNTAGCVSGISAIVNVTVNPLPTVSSIIGNQLICVGSSADFINTTAAGVWSSSNTAVATVTAAGLVTGYAAGVSSIEYKVTNANGCATTVSRDVFVNATPVVAAITGNTAICSGTQTQLNSSIPGNGSKVWTSSNTSVATVNNDGLVTGLSAGNATISYTVTSLSGCATTVTSNITINAVPAKPVLTASSATSFCLPGSVVLLSNFASGNQWFKDGVAILGATANSYSASVSGSYTVVVTNLSGCTSQVSDAIVVSANTAPAVPSLVAANASSFCVGGSVVLSTGHPTGNTWFKDGVIIPGANAGTYTATQSGIYTVQSSNTAGCVSGTSAGLTVTVNALPLVQAITGTQVVCAGSTTNFASTTAGGVWTSSNANIASINAAGQITGVTAGTTTISYTVTNASGCVTTVTRDITVTALPAKPTVSTNSTTSFCLPGTALLNSSTATGVQWYLDGTVIAGANAVTYLASQSGTYTVTSTESNCVSAQSNGLVITANALPVVSPIIGDQQVCENGFVKFSSATTGGGWISSNASVATVGGTGLVRGVAAGTATIRYRVINASGCVTTVTRDITVNAVPVLTAITGTQQVCVGSSTQLSSTANSTVTAIWSSSNPSVATVDANGLVSGLSAGTATINYKLTNLSGCTSTVTTTVTVNAVPLKPILTATGATSFCLPGSVTLSSSIATGNQWYRDGNVLVGATGNSYVASVTGTYTVIATNASGCVSEESDGIDVTANATPSIPSLKAVKNTSFCEGGNVRLSTSNQSGNSWYKDGILIAGVTGNSYTATQSGVYTVQVANTAGCVSGTSASLTVTVNPLPVVSAITGSQVVCAGSTTSFANATSGGVWSSSNANIANINAAGQISGVSAGTTTISYAVTNASGCIATVTRDITVTALPIKPTLSTNSSTSFCLPGTALLTSSTSTGVQWYLDGSAIAGATADRFTASQSGTYSITSTASGCVSAQSDGLLITVNALPVVSPIIGDQQVCENGFVKFSSATSGGGWISSNANIATVGGTGLVRGISAGTATIRYRVINASGCVTTVTRDITVNALPVLTAITGTQQVCVGASAQLNNSYNAAGTAIWSSGNTAVATIDAHGLVSGIAAGSAIINYSVTSASGCSTSVSTAFTVNAVPAKPTLTASGSTSFCLPGSVVLSSSISGGNQWYRDGVVIVGATGSSYVASVSGTYTVIASNASGCVGQESDGIDVTANATPSVPSLKAVKNTSFCEGGSVRLSTSNQTGNSWFRDGVLIAGVTGSSYTATQSGVYTVQVSNTSGCVSGTSAGLTVTVNAIPVVQAITGTQVVCAGSTTNFASGTAGGVWSSSNASIASINGAGQITGLSAGTATISYAVANASGCITTVTRDISVTALPVKPTINTNSATSFCLPGSAVLNSSAATGNQWYLDGVAIAGATGNSYTASVAGAYTVVTTQTGCVSAVSNALDIVTNTAPATPQLTAARSANVCEGRTVKLTTDNASGNSWYKDGVLIAGFTGSGYVASASGVYTVQHTNISGCISGLSAPVNVTINAVPVVAAISGTQQICVGGSTQFSNTTAGGTWISTNTGIATVDGTGMVVGIASGTANISYSVSNASGCTVTVTRAVTVNSLPVRAVLTAGSATAFCAPGSVTISSSVSSGNQWYKDGVVIAGATGNSYTASVTGTYTVITSNGSGCVSQESDGIDVTANATPTLPSIKAVKSTSFCEGGSVKLSTSNQSGNSWYKDGIIIPGVTGSSYTATQSGVYTVQVSNTAGCVSGTSAGLTVTVNALPIVQALTGTQTVCEGSVTNFASATGAGVWSSSNGNIASVNTVGQVTGLAVGTATISYAVSNASGCITVVARDVTVTALPVKPTVSSNSASSFCLPGSALLSSSAATGNQWYLNGNLITGATASTYTANQTGTYTVVTTAGGCASAQSDGWDITANASPNQPSLKAEGLATVCEGNAVRMITNNSGNNTWYKDGVLIAGATDRTYTASMSGNYTVRFTNLNGCSSSLSSVLSVTVNPLPIVPAITGGQQACVGSSIAFTNTAIGGTWLSSNTGVASINASGVATALAAGTTTISYTVQNSSGCTTAVTQLLTINSVPSKPLLSSIGATAFCLPGSVVLSSSISGGNQWYRDGVVIVGATGSSYVASVSGTYMVIASNASGCVGQESDGIDVTANATPSVPSLKAVKNTSFCEGGSVRLSTSNQTGNSWFRDGVLIAGVTGSSYTATQSGVYTVQVSNSSGCVSGTSAGLTVTVNAIPVVQAITGTQVVCAGSTTNFASGTAGGVWSSSNASIASINGAGQITGLSAGTATISYAVTKASGCITTVTRDISITALPVKPTINTNSATSFCLPGSAILNSSAATGNQWYLDGVAIAGATGNSYTASVAGAYTVVTTQTGCVSAVSNALDIITNTAPATPQLTAARSANVCEGRTVKLTTDNASGNSWYKDGVLIAGFTGSGYVASASGVYTVQHTNISGCISGLSAPVNVTINAVPVVAAISGTQQICVGGSTQFSNTTAGGTWISTNTGIATVDGTGMVVGIASGTANISYSVSNASGCTVTVTRAVTVNSLPVKAVLTAGSATTFCAPGSVTISSSVSSGNQWYKDGIAIVGATGNSYTAGATGTYTVITSNASGCVSQESDGIDVTANTTPTLPSIKAVKSTSFCEGGSVKLSTSNQSGNSWYKDGIIIPGVTGSSYTATASGVYTVQVSNTAGCVSGTSAGLTVTVNALPIVQALTGTQTVCEGSVTNFASATGSGVWSSSNGNIASVNTVGQVTGLAVGTATISYAVTNASGCITVVTRDITVTALPVKPTVSSNSASSFCLPGSALLSSSAATGNQWYLNGNLITGATASTYTANQTGTYTVVTTAGGCASAQSDGWDITANASPAQPSLKAVKNTVFCEGGSVKISTDYGSGNTWYKDAVVIPGVTGSFYNASVSGNYTVQHTNLNGCSSILSPVVSVTVNPLPIVPVITGAQEICVGNSAALSNALVGGTWSSSNTAIATISANGTITGIAAGTVNIMYTVANASGCISSVLSAIAVNALPSVSTIQGGSLICVGDSTLYSNQTQTGIWTSSNTSIAIVNANGMVKALSAGTVVISYTVSNGNGCKTSVNKTLTVNPLPSIPTITANGPLDFCVGSSVTLSSNATSSIIWYRDGLLLDTAINRKTIQAQLPGTYSSRNFNTYCIGALSNPIVVTNKPITKLDSIVGPNQICLNGSINLSNSITSGVWTSSNPNIATVDAQGLVSAKAIGTVLISYTANSTGNCPATITKSIVVNGLPATPLTTATGSATFCQGGSVLLTSSSNTNTVWYRDGIFIDTAFQSQTLLTGQSGTYTALVFDNNFCLSGLSNPINVSVTNPPAQPVISTTNPTTFCLPGSALLTSSAATGNQWYLNGSPIIGARGVTYSAAVSGSYTVIASQAGCVSVESDLIEISANATASIPSLKAAKSATVCEGNTVKLITGTASGNEWFKNGVLIPGVTGNSYTTTESGLYTVRSNNVAGCVSGTSQPLTVTILPQISIAPITGVNSICVNATTLFSSSTAGAIWSSNDTLTATVNSQGLVTAIRPGIATISYTIINAGGCVSKATKDILVNNLPVVPKVTVNGSTSFCSPGSVQLNSSFLSGNQWYLNGIAITGATDASYTATASGSYALGSTANGCSSTLSDAIDVQANLAPAVPVLRAVKGLVACQGASVQLVTASSGTNFWYKDGVLIDGVNGNQYNAIASGSYTVQTSNLAACVSGVSAALTVTIQPLPVLAALTGNQQICLNGTSSLSSSNAGGIWTSDNSPVAKVSNTGLVSGLALGSANIQYTLTGANGCSATTTRTVTVNPLPVVAAITGSNAVCVNAKTNFATLTSNGVWSSLNTSIATVNASTGEVTGIAAGTTTIRYTVINNSGCSTIVSKDIQVNPLPLVTANASASTVSKGRDITLTATGTGTFVWTPIQNISNVNAASTLARVTEKTTYTVSLTSALGCLNTASVTVDVVEDLYVEPTIVFTPNGDGFNDKFVIKNLDQYPNNRLQVFDRTGKVLFEQNDYANNWDGTVNGKLLTKDTYLYILTIKGQIVKKGTVTLVR